MRVLLFIALTAVGVMAEAKHNKPVNVKQMKGVEQYCAVYAKGFGADSTGEFLQAFPLAKCDPANQTPKEQEHFVFVLTQGAQILAVADAEGKGFSLELTKAEKTALKKRVRVSYSNPKLKKKIKPKKWFGGQ